MSSLEGLNKEQYEAATCKDPTILCLAGAGAGKTKTMLARIEHQVSEGVDPSSILALTFTNAAAFVLFFIPYNDFGVFTDKMIYLVSNLQCVINMFIFPRPYILTSYFCIHNQEKEVS